MISRDRLHSILSALRIAYEDTGKAVNVDCPFCMSQRTGQRDTERRCGVFVESGRFHCFRCHRTGNLRHLLVIGYHIDQDAFDRIVSGQWRDDAVSTDLTAAVRQRLAGRSVEPEEKKPLEPMPPESRKVNAEALADSSVLRRFLKNRRISLDTCETYEARYVGGMGWYAHRLCWPAYNDQGVLVAWQARDLTGKAKRKYLSHGDTGGVLYWSAEVRPPGRIYLVEGVLDCWRMEHSCVASFTKDLTMKQRRSLLADTAVKELVLCWDSDAWRQSLRVARELAPVLPRVGYVRLPDGEDPDSMGADAVRKLEISWA